MSNEIPLDIWQMISNKCEPVGQLALTETCRLLAKNLRIKDLSYKAMCNMNDSDTRLERFKYIRELDLYDNYFLTWRGLGSLSNIRELGLRQRSDIRVCDIIHLYKLSHITLSDYLRQTDIQKYLDSKSIKYSLYYGDCSHRCDPCLGPEYDEWY